MTLASPSPRLVSVVAEVLQVREDQVDLRADLRSLPGIDSVKVLRIITRLEQAYGIELQEDVVFELASLTELRELVEASVASAGSPARA